MMISNKVLTTKRVEQPLNEGFKERGNLDEILALQILLNDEEMDGKKTASVKYSL